MKLMDNDFMKKIVLFISIILLTVFASCSNPAGGSGGSGGSGGGDNALLGTWRNTEFPSGDYKEYTFLSSGTAEYAEYSSFGTLRVDSQKTFTWYASPDSGVLELDGEYDYTYDYDISGDILTLDYSIWNKQ